MVSEVKTKKNNNEDGTSNRLPQFLELFNWESRNLNSWRERQERHSSTGRMGSKSRDEKDVRTAWELESVISDRLNLPLWATRNVVHMLDQGNTLPFIARYRKEKTGDMEVDNLRAVCNIMQDLRSVESKISSVKAAIEKMGKLTNDIAIALTHAQTITEVDQLYAPYKPGNKGSLAERARVLGLQPLAEAVLKSSAAINLLAYVDPHKKGLTTVKEVETGVQHILADIIHKDKNVMDFVRKCCTDRDIVLQSTQAKATKKKTDNKKQIIRRWRIRKRNLRPIPVKFIKSHQVLAINRGEDNKVLSVKIVIPARIKDDFSHFAWRLFSRRVQMGEFAGILLKKSIEDAYERLIQPQMCRQIRSELAKKAEKDSIAVFASNLKHLLLTSPIKGKIILAVDPGFTNGCKCAVISPTGVCHFLWEWMLTPVASVYGGELRDSFKQECPTDGGTGDPPVPDVKQKAGQKRKAKPTVTKGKKKKKDDFHPNPLDMTWIHPESYESASLLMQKIGVDPKEIGQDRFIRKVQEFTRTNDSNSLAENMGLGLPTLKLIIEAFTRSINYDIRGEFAKPLFKKGLCSMEELNVGTVLTGRVENVTHFGAFVDIGVGSSGLIHTSRMNPRYMNGKQSLDLGDKVEVKVLSVEISRKRIGLELVKIL
ncbi:hypothetical protein ScPMuIL_014939 [Solemya velum]